MSNIKRFIYNNFTWYIKQMFPCLYHTEYEDEHGNKYVVVWRQWFNKSLWSVRYKYFERQEL